MNDNCHVYLQEMSSPGIKQMNFLCHRVVPCLILVMLMWLSIRLAVEV